MRPSIRRQFALIFIGLMAGIVLLCLFINVVFLEKYYVWSKRNVIRDAYETIRQAANDDGYDQAAFVNELDGVVSRDNVSVYIIDMDSQVKYVANGGQNLERRLLAYIFGLQTAEDVVVLEDAEEYRIQRTGKEGAEYLEMYGRLNSGISFIMRTPIESIRESSKLANRFFAYVGVLGTAAGAVTIWLVSRKLTQPILELNAISERMVHLDFEAKYQGKARNELDLLGENINKLSASLETSISRLRAANDELQDDIRKKEEINEMRKEFLSNVSHELKTPIALIQGYAEGLRESVNDDPESRDFYCDVIMDEASKMNSMVKKLLMLNQLESGMDDLSMECFDVTALIGNYLQSAEILCRQNGIVVQMAEYEPVYVWADEIKVEEVFANYFSNAVNHCKGERRIEIRLENAADGVRILVFNTGEQIPEQALGHIWDKFYKVDKARTREYGGSGVGLSIVKAAMEALGRDYGVENCDDGVCFWFELELSALN
ncbi:MAG: HAMP domain-containing histidine kinase [Candidatus Gastranaerophilales bacterium]|nr:HAMP domain-containing histidine kinase [Candidatus Gastranaerophilales bacterium]